MKFKKLKDEPAELKLLKQSINNNDNNRLIDKILKSEEIDKIIIKLQNIYNKVSEKLFVKYDLKNELKQGKLFTIIIALLIFIYLIVITIFFTIMLNSLLGLNFIFSVLRYSIFFIKWGYTILKNKGFVIKKYLANLFPDSKLLNEKKEINIDGLPVFESEVLKEINNLTLKLDNLDIDNFKLKELAIRLKNILNMLNLNDNEYLQEFKSLEYKSVVIKQLMDIKNEIKEIEIQEVKEKRFLEVKMEIEDEINSRLNEKVYKKIKY